MRLLLSILISVLYFVPVKAQSKLGTVACIYIHTQNLDSSIAYYNKLGFAKISSKTNSSSSAQLTDGSLLITLKKDTSAFIGLTYYVPDVDKLAESLEQDNIEFIQKPKDGDEIKRYYIKSPDGLDIVLASNNESFKQPTGINMSNMKPVDFHIEEKYPNKIAGVFGEFAHPVRDLKASIQFWEKLGFTVKSQMNFPYPHAILSDGLMLIGLHKTRHFTYPAITYFGLENAEKVKRLKKKGIKNIEEVAGPNNVSLKTWEGQHFFIFSLSM